MEARKHNEEGRLEKERKSPVERNVQREGRRKEKEGESSSMKVRINTRLLYQQIKFNLLREESEGYAKLNYDHNG
ncbi:hypothetical protein K1719_012351 [Acacia pycnantha]|nr:hypothetical protein K1719_012351 [Acacia pycnantha]